MLSCMKIALWQLKNWKFNMRIFMTLAMTVIITYMGIERYLNYVGETEKLTNCVEAYIYLNDNIFSLTLLFLLSVLLFADAPFMENNALYSMIRTGRIKWCTGKIIYILTTSILFNLIVLSGTVVMSLKYAYPGNIWSAAFTFAAEGNVAASNNNVFYDNIGVLMNLTPYKTVFIIFSLNVIYCFFTGLLLFALNLSGSRIAGFAITSILHFLGFMYAETSLSRFMPFSDCILKYHDFGGTTGMTNLIKMRWSLVYMIGILVVLICFIMTRINKVDLKITIGDRQ